MHFSKLMKLVGSIEQALEIKRTNGTWRPEDLILEDWLGVHGYLSARPKETPPDLELWEQCLDGLCRLAEDRG